MEVSRPSSSGGLVSSLHSADQYDNSFVYADENRSNDVLGGSLTEVNSPNGEIQSLERPRVNPSASSATSATGERIDCWSPVVVSDRAFGVTFADRSRCNDSQILQQVCAVKEGCRSTANCANILEVDSSSENMIDSIDCRQQHQVQHLNINGHHQGAGRLSSIDQPVSYVVGQNTSDLNNGVFAADSIGGSTYAMLTTLKPLPPISTVSERLGSNGTGFVFMQDCGGGHNQNTTGNSSYNSYKYETLEGNEMQLQANCNGYQPSAEAVSAPLRLNNAGYVSTLASQYPTYGPPANCHIQLHPVKSEMMGSMGTMNGMSGYEGPTGYTNSSRMVSSLPVEMQTKPNSGEMMHPSVESLHVLHGNISSPTSSLMAPLHQTHIAVEHSRQAMVSQHRVGSPDQPSSSTDLHGGTVKSLRQTENGGSGSSMEEISTRDVAQRVSNELKRYSIPQAVFAQRVLGRSQGTLSDLLRNPKPWSKLKSGRETFRRMWKWLQEPEYQRMAALRSMASSMSATSYNGTDAITTGSSSSTPAVKQQSLSGCKRGRDASSLCSSSGATLPAVGLHSSSSSSSSSSSACPQPQKKPRMVFTEIQRRTLVAIFREIKRPSKEIQATIAEQLGLKVSTVVNFFMNARRRSVDKYLDEVTGGGSDREMSAVSSTASTIDDMTSRGQ